MRAQMLSSTSGLHVLLGIYNPLPYSQAHQTHASTT